jgi:hypothetical protein
MPDLTPTAELCAAAKSPLDYDQQKENDRG